MRKPLVARTSEINAAYLVHFALARHPHGEDETESSMLAPEFGQIIHNHALARKCHSGIAYNQRGVRYRQHRCDIGRALRPLRLNAEKLSEDDLNHRSRRARRDVERDRANAA